MAVRRRFVQSWKRACDENPYTSLFLIPVAMMAAPAIALPVGWVLWKLGWVN